MSDELNDPAIEAYRDASYADAKGGGTLDAERDAATVIRTYGDERHAAGYQAAIADVVEWLESSVSITVPLGVGMADGASSAQRQIIAGITRRFGKDA